MVYLRTIKLLREDFPNTKEYPFHLPSLRKLEAIELASSVTFFVGENGSGKSTLLEAVAYQCGFHTAGGSRNNFYEVHRSEASLGDYIRLSWLPKITNGFFLRAESFYQFASHIDQMGSESYKNYGGRSLHDQSHGESFFALFANRFNGRGIYLLDEPEAALSPKRQIAFLYVMRDLVEEGAQFIIATHSPILLGYPGATILNFDESPVHEVNYRDTEHYQLTRRFLEKPDLFLDEK
ncbi:AAA family ATPase [Brevibacillus formosus]|uniref:AAA family ATPase n=1 Tax=Brevibacillus TaxID=55080 RepID=UPI000D1053E1|nr:MULTISPECIES: AAA family ATPase [Brevibacillus]MBG9942524.1 ATPase AAA [Brevibacillus formosus]MED1946602.1 AAA family ATPase [Brevibacillus formosus]MED1996860.1 AAA family ATPase [Brevibacillus formosus]MED2084777.1 AAA family ATPase [Brevibacillus formosus]PSK21365.1 AAA family ATPase [Brevibacillus sp. NRRL NRS-603]